MGSGSYSVSNSVMREADYSTKSRHMIFTSSTRKDEMNPVNTMRECRDSNEHPETIPIIIGLDVTGSMGRVPEKFIKEGMTKMMSTLYDAGLVDAQVLFMGIGDHECDDFPLQVGQFEADDQLLDKWLKTIYLEGGGGGNDGESYLLAWKYASDHVSIDSFEKRGKKGFLFTIGDEPNLKLVDGRSMKSIFGSSGQVNVVSAEELYESASEKFEVFHIVLKDTSRGKKSDVERSWKEKIGDRAVVLDTYTMIPETISTIIISEMNAVKSEFTANATKSEEVML